MLDFPDNTHLSKWQVIQPQPQVILFRTFSITRVKLTRLQLLHFYLSYLFLHNFSVFGHYLWPVDVWKMETPQIADAGIMNKKNCWRISVSQAASAGFGLGPSFSLKQFVFWYLEDMANVSTISSLIPLCYLEWFSSGWDGLPVKFQLGTLPMLISDLNSIFFCPSSNIQSWED